MSPFTICIIALAVIAIIVWLVIGAAAADELDVRKEPWWITVLCVLLGPIALLPLLFKLLVNCSDDDEDDTDDDEEESEETKEEEVVS